MGTIPRNQHRHAPVEGATIAVPGLFWADHADRRPGEAQGDAIAKPVGCRGPCVLLRAEDPGLRTLLADAAYYSDPDGPDECPEDIRASARRTLAALARAGVKAGEGA